MDAELAHKTRNHAKEGDIGEKARTHEIIKSVGAIGSQRAGDLNNDLAFGGIELSLEGFRGHGSELGRVGKRRSGDRGGCLVGVVAFGREDAGKDSNGANQMKCFHKALNFPDRG